jgi:hypothetical protein
MKDGKKDQDERRCLSLRRRARAGGHRWAQRKSVARVARAATHAEAPVDLSRMDRWKEEGWVEGGMDGRRKNGWKEETSAQIAL